MAHHENEHEHGHAHEHAHGHQHEHHHGRRRKGLHKDWRAWLVAGLMLAAMLAYVLSDNEALQPGSAKPGQGMPAAVPPPAGAP